MNLGDNAKEIYMSAIKSVDPFERTLCEIQNVVRDGETVSVIAVGKAAVPMAAAAEKALGNRIKRGLCITKYGHTGDFSPEHFEIIEAAHPVSDENSVIAAEKAMEIAKNALDGDTVLVLLSGGASALMEKSRVGSEVQRRITEKLLKRGADIEETNAVRRRLSLVKGGLLAAECYPARVVTLALSDVLSNDKSAIGSGVTVPDTTPDEFVLAAAKKYLYDEPAEVIEALKGRETPKINDGGYRFVGDISLLCRAAAEKASSLGYDTHISETLLTGEARSAAENIVSDALNSKCKKSCFIYGGETTVTVKGNGLGGRNQEAALCAAIALDGKKDIVFVSVGSDGTDGPTDAAGGIADGETAEIIRAAGLSPEKYLENNDSYNALKAGGALIVTGPTGTNVNDLAFVLIGG